VRAISIGSYPISACAIYTTSALVFLSFSYFVFACTFYTLHFANHKEKHLKCMRICKFLSCFYFPRSGWRKWPKVKFHFLSNARERAHESVNGPLIWLLLINGGNSYLLKMVFLRSLTTADIYWQMLLSYLSGL